MVSLLAHVVHGLGKNVAGLRWPLSAFLFSRVLPSSLRVTTTTSFAAKINTCAPYVVKTVTATLDAGIAPSEFYQNAEKNFIPYNPRRYAPRIDFLLQLPLPIRLLLTSADATKACVDEKTTSSRGAKIAPTPLKLPA